MASDWSIVLADLDGTLLSPDGTVSTGNRHALARLGDAGIELLVATGRCRNESLHILEEVGYEGALIVAGGALMVEHASGSTIDRETIDPDVVERVVRHLHAEGHTSLVLKDHEATGYDYLLVGGDGLHPVSEWWMNEMDITCRRVDRLEDDPNPADSVRVGGIGEAPLLSGSARRIKEDVGDRTRMLNWPAVTASHVTGTPVHIIEVFAPAVDKWTMALRHCSRSGLDPNHVAAVGDGLNDMGMLEGAAMGIAMGNAEVQVRERADWTTRPNTDDGFAHAVRHLLEEDGLP